MREAPAKTFQQASEQTNQPPWDEFNVVRWDTHSRLVPLNPGIFEDSRADVEITYEKKKKKRQKTK